MVCQAVTWYQNLLFSVNKGRDVDFTLQEALGQRALLSCSVVTLM